MSNESLPKKGSNTSQSSVSSHKKNSQSSVSSGHKPSPKTSEEREATTSYTTENEYEEPSEDISEIILRETLSSKIKEHIWPTLSDYGRKLLTTEPLFKEILKHEDPERFLASRSLEEASILITGFGLRNVQSLEDALKKNERKRLLELYVKKLKEQRKIIEEERRRKHSLASTSTGRRSQLSTTAETVTQTEISSSKSDFSQEKRQLEYLLGLETQLEGGAEDTGLPFPTMIHRVESEEEMQLSKSKNMRQAQKYLRTHRIFEFINFLVTHLLSDTPENPIEFLLNLLNQCLMYRSGLGSAPLLYDKKHIEQLFNLMDRMKSGFLDYTQYVIAMNTLGICSYNKFPNTTSDNQVSKEVFIDEIYEAEVELFEDLIKRRRSPTKEPVVISYSTPSITQQSDRKPYFIPSDLLKFKTKDTGKDTIQTGFEEFGG